MSTWLITGCSTGRRSRKRPWHGAIPSRRRLAMQPRSRSWSDAHTETALALPLDVTDRGQITRAVREAQSDLAALNVSSTTPATATVPRSRRRMTATCRRCSPRFFGPVALMKAVLPDMRARRHGTIVEHFVDRGATLAAGVRLLRGEQSRAGSIDRLAAQGGREAPPLGIAAMIVEPGAFRTDFSGRSLEDRDPAVRSMIRPRRLAAAGRRTTPRTALSKAIPPRQRRAQIRRSCSSSGVTR